MLNIYKKQANRARSNMQKKGGRATAARKTEPESPYDDPLTVLMDIFNIQSTEILSDKTFSYEGIEDLEDRIVAYVESADPARRNRMSDIGDYTNKLLDEIQSGISYEEMYTTWFYIITKLKLIHAPFSRYVANIPPPDELFEWDKKLFDDSTITLQSQKYYANRMYAQSGVSFTRFIRSYRRLQSLKNWLPQIMSLDLLSDVSGLDSDIVNNLIQSGVLTSDESGISVADKSFEDLMST